MWQSLLEPFRRHTSAAEKERRERDHEVGIVEELHRQLGLKIQQREDEIRVMQHRSQERHSH